MVPAGCSRREKYYRTVNYMYFDIWVEVYIHFHIKSNIADSFPAEANRIPQRFPTITPTLSAYGIESGIAKLKELIYFHKYPPNRRRLV